MKNLVKNLKTDRNKQITASAYITMRDYPVPVNSKGEPDPVYLEKANKQRQKDMQWAIEFDTRCAEVYALNGCNMYIFFSLAVILIFFFIFQAGG